MTTEFIGYTTPTVTTPPPPLETWTEIRCCACVPLGWQNSRLLFKVYGAMSTNGACVQVICHRCKSLISWQYGTPRIIVMEYGPKNNKRQKVNFE